MKITIVNLLGDKSSVLSINSPNILRQHVRGENIPFFKIALSHSITHRGEHAGKYIHATGQ